MSNIENTLDKENEKIKEAALNILINEQFKEIAIMNNERIVRLELYKALAFSPLAQQINAKKFDFESFLCDLASKIIKRLDEKC
jgi:replication initiation and membrane attachment protein DnaB